jgi:hypothetical protein
MRTRLVGLGIALLAGGALGACNLVLGLGDRDTTAGTGGGNPSATASSQTAGSSGGGHGGGDAGNDADAGPLPRGVWAVSFGTSSEAKVSVNAIAVGPDGHVLVTGHGTNFGTLSCPMPLLVGTNPTGFLVELDGATGACVWACFFGGSTGTGTGVATDANGYVALSGSFTDGLVNPNVLYNVFGIDAFVEVFQPLVNQKRGVAWSAQIGDPANVSQANAGNQIATSVALQNGMVAVAGTYTKDLLVDPTGPVFMAPMPQNNQDAFALWFSELDGSFQRGSIITSPGGVQSATGIALDKTANGYALTGTTSGDTSIDGIDYGIAASTTGNAFFAFGNFPMMLSNALLFGGASAQDGRTVAFDDSGNVLMTADFTGALTVGGGSGSYTSKGGKDALVIRYDPSGMPLASISFGSDVMDTTIAGAAPFADVSGAAVAIGGSYLGTAQFGNGLHITNAGSKPKVYVARLSGTLDKVTWLESYGDEFGQAVDAITVDPNPTGGGIVVAGVFQGTLDFGPKASITNNTASPQIFVAKLNP